MWWNVFKYIFTAKYQMKIVLTTKTKCAEATLFIFYYLTPQAHGCPAAVVEFGTIIMCDVRMWTISICNTEKQYRIHVHSSGGGGGKCLLEF